MDFTTKRNKDFSFLNFYDIVMRCELVVVRNLERTRDTEESVKWRLPMKAHEPDEGTSRVSTLAHTLHEEHRHLEPVWWTLIEAGTGA